MCAPLLLLLLCCLGVASAQAQDLPRPVGIPTGATALEGLPAIAVSSGEEQTERKILTQSEAAQNRLLVTIVEGKFYWASRENRVLELSESGAFTYLHAGPAGYIKFARVGNKIVYMEHINIFLTTLTYWGELQMLTGR